MGFNAQYSNHNAQYGALRYASLGFTYSNNFSETLSTAYTSNAALIANAAINEGTTQAINYSILAQLNALFSEGVSTSDAESTFDYSGNMVAEIVLTGDSMLALLLAASAYSDFVYPEDSMTLFSDISSPTERFIAIIKEKRSF